MIILKIKRQSLFQILWKDLMQKLSEEDVTYLWTSVSVHRVYSVICWYIVELKAYQEHCILKF